MAIPIPTITSAGITIPTFAQILAAFQTGYQGIYGATAQLGPNTLDGQLISFFAQAYFDLCQVIGETYNNFSPLSAQGPMLDNMVALNGVSRSQASFSTVPIIISGTVGSVILNGQIGDNLGLGTLWNLPASVTIPNGGVITVTATCSVAGNITAQPNTLNVIQNPQVGWLSANNSLAATVGNPFQTDAQLSQIQQLTVAAPSLTFMAGINAAVLAVAGVTETVYDNNVTGVTDANSVPGHSFSIVYGGTASVASVATAIALSKPPGIGTFGTSNFVFVDQNGVPETINLYQVAMQELIFQITIHRLAGYQTATAAAIQTAVFNFINSLAIAEPSYLNRIFIPAGLTGAGQQGTTFVVTGIQQALFGNTLGTADLTPSFFTQFFCNLSDITIIAA
jgi:uncharacterized phage protein gp47/JayE